METKRKPIVDHQRQPFFDTIGKYTALMALRYKKYLMDTKRNFCSDSIKYAKQAYRDAMMDSYQMTPIVWTLPEPCFIDSLPTFSDRPTPQLDNIPQGVHLLLMSKEGEPMIAILRSCSGSSEDRLQFICNVNHCIIPAFTIESWRILHVVTDIKSY